MSHPQMCMCQIFQLLKSELLQYQPKHNNRHYEINYTVPSNQEIRYVRYVESFVNIE